eukprot:CAMPEP_0206455956 /NCGR_PEP_ID=MMETSP0324_2-20121206/22081_1 /ASSEMBLY_ACC=CAM_ASM_000836 /TAXON_ID=2866 /ORGANISM="Crypthecodinium cohnii, Strain Seligo" /LENGTH=433 /DNA_ID=CAMNT_0053926799 /DNA_START=239 /DNA_END=1540 /DNA_ORIENTATION=+
MDEIRNALRRFDVPLESSKAVGFGLWVLYAVIMFLSFYSSFVYTPQLRRIRHENKELRLPRLYFCPADRNDVTGFMWHSAECILKFREERQLCGVSSKAYKGREPEDLKGNGNPDDRASQAGGTCLEFNLNVIGVREEMSAAWNEIHLRAAFAPPDGFAQGHDDLEEIELGYEPTDVELVAETMSVTEFYAPLIRLPFFYTPATRLPNAQGLLPPAPGVATRAFLRRQLESYNTEIKTHWEAYGMVQIPLKNASVPLQKVSALLAVPPRLAVAHIVITVQDFAEFDLEEVSTLLPFLQLVGSIAGVGAALALYLNINVRKLPFSMYQRGSGHGPDIEMASEYVAVARDEQDSEGEQSALLRPPRQGGGSEGHTADRDRQSAQQRRHRAQQGTSEDEEDDEEGPSRVALLRGDESSPRDLIATMTPTSRRIDGL